MSESSKQKKDSKIKLISETLTIGKDLFSLLRDFSLFTVVVLLMIFPNSLKEILENAGIVTINVAGIQWKQKLSNSTEELNELNVTINNLKNKNAELSKALNEAQKKITDPELNKRIKGASHFCRNKTLFAEITREINF